MRAQHQVIMPCSMMFYRLVVLYMLASGDPVLLAPRVFCRGIEHKGYITACLMGASRVEAQGVTHLMQLSNDLFIVLGCSCELCQVNLLFTLLLLLCLYQQDICSVPAAGKRKNRNVYIVRRHDGSLCD